MVNPRQKGNRGEQQVISMLDRLTEESWTQTPGSGSGKIKGDLMVQDKHNLFTVEVKFYKECGFNSKIYTQKSNNLFKWWSKLCKQAQQMEQEPLLIFRENHGKFFAATVRKPKNTLQYMHIAWLGAYILIAEHWLEKEEIRFTNGDTILRPWEPSPDWQLADS
jgi:hypothetical protein